MAWRQTFLSSLAILFAEHRRNHCGHVSALASWASKQQRDVDDVASQRYTAAHDALLKRALNLWEHGLRLLADAGLILFQELGHRSKRTLWQDVASALIQQFNRCANDANNTGVGRQQAAVNHAAGGAEKVLDLAECAFGCFEVVDVIAGQLCPVRVSQEL